MNAQKSHDILLKKFDKLCGDYFYQNADKIDYEQALWDGAQALEKQIPKKPKLDNDNGIYETEHCPNCYRKLFPNEHHCKCGQALDWSDTE